MNPNPRDWPALQWALARGYQVVFGPWGTYDARKPIGCPSCLRQDGEHNSGCEHGSGTAES